jgi:tryptophan-rich sensory protein
MTLTIVVATLIMVAVLGFGGLMTKIDSWYGNLRKPSWNPPNWLFGPAWTVILILAEWAGLSAWRAAPTPTDHVKIAVLFAVNIVLHGLWSPLFFNLRRPDWALIEAPMLWLSIAALMVGLAPYSHLAILLLSPYLLWVTFAVVLNAVIVRMNGPFGGKRVPAE